MNNFVSFNFYVCLVERVVYWMLYNLLYVCSLCQIKCRNIASRIKLGFSSMNQLTITDRPTVKLEMVSKGVEHRFTNSDNDSCLNIQNIVLFFTKMRGSYNSLANNHKEEECVIYTVDRPANNGVSDKVIISDNVLSNSDFGDDAVLKYEYTDYNFMSIQLRFLEDPDSTSYVVKLKMPTENYYIVGNKLNYAFVLYYSKKYLNLGELIERLTLLDGTIQYEINIVDHDVNCFALDSDGEVVFQKTDYTVVTK